MNNTPIRINYQRKLDELLQELSDKDSIPTLLLHSCCGPCSSYVVTYLKTYFQVTVLYYNPNIFPEEEYRHRLSEQVRLLKELDVPLLEIGYDHSEFLEVAEGLEGEPEGGARCERCFELRLSRTRELAQERGFDYFCTTLTVSPHKNAMVINRVGEQLAAADASEVQRCDHPSPIYTDRASEDAASVISRPMWLPSDFKKKEGYKRSIELSRQYDLYRQDYCGCEFAWTDQIKGTIHE